MKSAKTKVKAPEMGAFFSAEWNIKCKMLNAECKIADETFTYVILN